MLVILLKNYMQAPMFSPFDVSTLSSYLQGMSPSSTYPCNIGIKQEVYSPTTITCHEQQEHAFALGSNLSRVFKVLIPIEQAM